jgi:hypothetical protein
MINPTGAIRIAAPLVAPKGPTSSSGPPAISAATAALLEGPQQVQGPSLVGPHTGRLGPDRRSHSSGHGCQDVVHLGNVDHRAVERHSVEGTTVVHLGDPNACIGSHRHMYAGVGCRECR